MPARQDVSVKMMPMQKFLTKLPRWLPAVLMMAAIFGFSSIPSSEMPRFGLLDLLVKKGGHALGYALLALAFLHWRRPLWDAGVPPLKILALAWVWPLPTLRPTNSTSPLCRGAAPARSMC